MTPPTNEFSPGTVRACNFVEQPENGSITICNDKQQPSDSKIVICNETPVDEESEAGPDPCEGIGAPTIGSPASSAEVTGDPTSGTVITISGGKPPYSVAYSAGTVVQISATQWRIASLDTCGTSGSPAWGTITASDSCGGMATRDVRNSGGIWCCLQPIGEECPENIPYNCSTDWAGGGTGGYSCKDSQGFNCYINGYTYIVGGFLYTDNITCYQGDRTCDSTPLDGSNPCTDRCTTDPCDHPCVVARWIAEWRCL